MLAGCLDVPSLKDIGVVPQSGGIDLRHLVIVWLHLLQYKIGGVQQVWLINPSCILEYCKAFLQCSQSSRILPYQARSNQWSSRGIYVLCPCDGHFSIFPYYASMSERTPETTAGSTCYVFRSSTLQSIVHYLLSMILFITHKSYSFL